MSFSEQLMYSRIRSCVNVGLCVSSLVNHCDTATLFYILLLLILFPSHMSPYRHSTSTLIDLTFKMASLSRSGSLSR